MAYARIAAGISVDMWPFGEITISVHLGARIEVEGPDFHGTATIEVGPCELTVEFGSSDQHRTPPLGCRRVRRQVPRAVRRRRRSRSA